MNGVLVLDKPSGPTSHDIVGRVRRSFRTRHVGHAGTLDPMATGVLVLALGEATKLVPWLTAADKAYEATIRLGIATDTLDAQGKEVERRPVPSTLPLDDAIAAEAARTSQVPPAYSAIRVDGKRAHALARKGHLEEGDLPARPIEVRALELLHVTGDEVVVKIDVSKGYFVRSFARDLAERLGTVGHLTALRRTRSGAFTIEEACLVDELDPARLLSVDVAAARALPTTILDERGVRAAIHGQRLSPTWVRDPHACPSAWLDASARLIAVGEFTAEGHGQVLRGFDSR